MKTSACLAFFALAGCVLAIQHGELVSELGDPGQVYGKNYIIAIDPKDEKCLQFEYQIKPVKRKLTVALKIGGAIATPIWSAAGGSGEGWKRTSIGIHEREQMYRIVFEGVRDADRNGPVVIRYITVKDGPCNGGEPESELGDPGQVYGKNYIIAINPKDEKCLEFEYRVKPAERKLTVALKIGDAIATPIWSAAGGSGEGWNRTSIGIHEREQKYKIVFDGVRYANRNDPVAIRYVTVNDGPCDAAEPTNALSTVETTVESEVELDQDVYSPGRPSVTDPPKRARSPAKFVCGKQDIVFFVDSSGSLSEEDFDAAIQFIIAFLEMRGEYGDDGIQASVVVFAEPTNLKIAFGFNSYNTKQEVIDAVRAIEQFSPGQLTYLYHAIMTALPIVMADARTGIAQPVMIILTDGIASDETVQNRLYYNGTFAAIESNNVSVFPVGSSFNYDEKQLKGLAGKNNVTYARGFGELASRLSDLASNTCPTTPTPMPTTTTPSPVLCGKQDIVFFVDSSGSITEEDFDIMKEFIIALIEMSGEYGDNGIRASVVVFAERTNLKIAFGFDSYNTKQDVIDAIRAIEQFSPEQTTHLYHAIMTALPILMADARTGISQAVMIILTDGIASDETARNRLYYNGTFAAIESNNVSVFPVGISSDRDETQLKGLAGKNSVTYAEGFGDLASRLSDLASKTCPITTTPSPVICGKQDIVFFVDSSGSITKEDFDIMKEFIIALIKMSGEYGDHGMRVSVVVFAEPTNLKIAFGFNSYHTKQDVIDAIRAIEQFSPEQTTHLYNAIMTALPILMADARTGISQAVMIILTDGIASDENARNRLYYNGTFAAIESNNVSVFPVGISSDRDERQLKGLAGKNNVTYAEGFGELASRLSDLASKTCPITTTPSPVICGKQDIVFFVDSSGSITKEDFDIMKEFIIALIEMSGEYGDHGMRASVVVFAKHTNLKIAFGFNSYNTTQEVIDAIRAIEQFSPEQMTHLYNAIMTALPIVMADARTGIAQAVVIILTDGIASDETDLNRLYYNGTFAAIESNNVSVFPVGISSNRDERQLKGLAGKNNVTYADGFGELASRLTDLASKTCPTTTPSPVICDKQDIVFFVDSSGSITKDDFDIMKEFIIALIEMSGEYGDNGMRISVVVFAERTNLKIAFGFNSYHTKQEVIDAIRAIEQFSPEQKTHLYNAIMTALPIVMADARTGIAQAVMIILTDGIASDETDLNRLYYNGTFAAIESNNVSVFPVGISSNRDERQLKGLAGPNNVTYAEGFGELASRLSDLASKTCPITTTPSPVICGKQDIVFFVDSSGSISEEDFDDMIEFIIGLIELSGEYGDDGIRASVVVFAKHTNLKIAFGFNSYNTKQDVIDAIRAIEQFPQGEMTHLYHAIMTALPTVMANARTDTAHAVMIILTDGRAKDETDLGGKFYNGAFDAIERYNVSVFPVGISSDRDEMQLKGLAGKNNLTYAEGYRELASHLFDLASKTCPTSTTPSQTTTTLSPLLYRLICESTTLSITCHMGKAIFIVYASYGRTSSTICTSGRPESQLSKTDCISQTAQAKVENDCNGKSTCALSASNSFFGDPCVGTCKYLEVYFTCE